MVWKRVNFNHFIWISFEIVFLHQSNHGISNYEILMQYIGITIDSILKYSFL